MPFHYIVLAILLIPSILLGEEDFLSESYRPLHGSNLADCQKALNERSGGWCEIRPNSDHPSISSVWPDKLDKKTRMVTGPSSVLRAWNSAAFDQDNYILYFTGGGHADYGGNEVYQFELLTGDWTRLTEPSPLNHLYVLGDYNARKGKPWRRLCWTPDFREVPASTHTYDGLIFSKITKTIFLYVMRAANGSCYEDLDDKYKDSPIVIGSHSDTRGWYEFNPSKKDLRNGIDPLSWRRVFDSGFLQKNSLSQGYPGTAQDNEGRIIFGSRLRTSIYDPLKPSLQNIQRFSSQADWGDGTKIYDKYRNIVWSIHRKALLAFDGNSGNLLDKYDATVPHGKSLAIAGDRKIYSWSGGAEISMFDPNGERTWKTMDWGMNGPPVGDSRVYGKWLYLDREKLFVGLSTDKTGVWIYKHPTNPIYINYSKINPQKLIDRTKEGDSVTIPPGTYRNGIFINKSLTVNLKNALLLGTVKRKGIINVKCNDCRVLIENFSADGKRANCQWGNCAAVKVEGKRFHLTLNTAHIDGTAMGILTDNRGGELIVEDSLIENTGFAKKPSGLNHGIYAGIIDKVVVRNSIVRRSFGKGHIFKSRAPYTQIENSVLAGLDGHHSRIVDFPCGGRLSILDSVLQQGNKTDNIDLISVGTEPKHCGGSVRSSNVSITNNWIIFDRDESKDEPANNYGFNRFFTWRAPIEKIVVSGNRIVETTGRFKFDGEDHVPDLSDGNQFYKSRKAAGLGPVQLPDRPTR